MYGILSNNINKVLRQSYEELFVFLAPMTKNFLSERLMYLCLYLNQFVARCTYICVCGCVCLLLTLSLVGFSFRGLKYVRLLVMSKLPQV